MQEGEAAVNMRTNVIIKVRVVRDMRWPVTKLHIQGAHTSLLERDDVPFGEYLLTFRNIIMPPFSGRTA